MSAEMKRRVQAGAGDKTTPDQREIMFSLDAAVHVYARDAAADYPEQTADVDAVLAIAKSVPLDIARQIEEWVKAAKNAGRAEGQLIYGASR